MWSNASKVYEIPLHRIDTTDPQHFDDPVTFFETFDAHGFEHPNLPGHTLTVRFGPLCIDPTQSNEAVEDWLNGWATRCRQALQPGYEDLRKTLVKNKLIAVVGMGKRFNTGIKYRGKPL